MDLHLLIEIILKQVIKKNSKKKKKMCVFTFSVSTPCSHGVRWHLFFSLEAGWPGLRGISAWTWRVEGLKLLMTGG